MSATYFESSKRLLVRWFDLHNLIQVMAITRILLPALFCCVLLQNHLFNFLLRSVVIHVILGDRIEQLSQIHSVVWFRYTDPLEMR